MRQRVGDVFNRTRRDQLEERGGSGVLPPNAMPNEPPSDLERTGETLDVDDLDAFFDRMNNLIDDPDSELEAEQDAEPDTDADDWEDPPTSLGGDPAEGDQAGEQTLDTRLRNDVEQARQAAEQAMNEVLDAIESGEVESPIRPPSSRTLVNMARAIEALTSRDLNRTLGQEEFASVQPFMVAFSRYMHTIEILREYEQMETGSATTRNPFSSGRLSNDPGRNIGSTAGGNLTGQRNARDRQMREAGEVLVELDDENAMRSLILTDARNVTPETVMRVLEEYQLLDRINLGDLGAREVAFDDFIRLVEQQGERLRQRESREEGGMDFSRVSSRLDAIESLVAERSGEQARESLSGDTLEINGQRFDPARYVAHIASQVWTVDTDAMPETVQSWDDVRNYLDSQLERWQNRITEINETPEAERSSGAIPRAESRVETLTQAIQGLDAAQQAPTEQAPTEQAPQTAQPTTPQATSPESTSELATPSIDAPIPNESTLIRQYIHSDDAIRIRYALDVMEEINDPLREMSITDFTLNDLRDMANRLIGLASHENTLVSLSGLIQRLEARLSQTTQTTQTTSPFPLQESDLARPHIENIAEGQGTSILYDSIEAARELGSDIGSGGIETLTIGNLMAIQTLIGGRSEYTYLYDNLERFIERVTSPQAQPTTTQTTQTEGVPTSLEGFSNRYVEREGAIRSLIDALDELSDEESIYQTARVGLEDSISEDIQNLEELRESPEVNAAEIEELEMMISSDQSQLEEGLDISSEIESVQEQRGDLESQISDLINEIAEEAQEALNQFGEANNLDFDLESVL